jgi:hypothetical protein
VICYYMSSEGEGRPTFGFEFLVVLVFRAMVLDLVNQNSRGFSDRYRHCASIPYCWEVIIVIARTACLLTNRSRPIKYNPRREDLQIGGTQVQ